MIYQCPDWVEDIPASERDEFAKRLASIFEVVRESACQSLLGERDILAWHLSLFQGFVPLDYYAGNFRQDDPKRPCLGRPVNVAGVLGSDFRLVTTEIAALFEAFIKISRTFEVRWPALAPRERAIQLARAIAYLVGMLIKIHPFLNGNGRVSRLTWSWTLVRFGVPIQCRVIPRPKGRYEQLMASAMKGDFAPLALAVLNHLAAHPPQQV